MSENVVIIIETRRGARNKKFVGHDLATANVGWNYTTAAKWAKCQTGGQ